MHCTSGRPFVCIQVCNLRTSFGQEGIKEACRSVILECGEKEQGSLALPSFVPSQLVCLSVWLPAVSPPAVSCVGRCWLMGHVVDGWMDAFRHQRIITSRRCGCCRVVRVMSVCVDGMAIHPTQMLPLFLHTHETMDGWTLCVTLHLPACLPAYMCVFPACTLTRRLSVRTGAE